MSFLDFATCEIQDVVGCAVGKGRELAAARSGEPHLTAGILSALPDDWPVNPCYAANHGCYHPAEQGSYRHPALDLSTHLVGLSHCSCLESLSILKQ
jgi:hypothetical protein